MTSVIRGTIIAIDVPKRLVTIRSEKGAVGILRATSWDSMDGHWHKPLQAYVNRLPVAANLAPGNEILSLDVAD